MKSYAGYSSYESNCSHTEEYDMERLITDDNKQQQPHYNHHHYAPQYPQKEQQQQIAQDLTYQQSSRVLTFDPQCDITNKIKISHALITQNRQSHYPFPFHYAEYPKIQLKTEATERNISQRQYENEQCRPRQISRGKKSRAASLIYFRQKLKGGNRQSCNIKRDCQNDRENINLPLQCPQITNKSTNINKSKSNISISPGKYFPKNEPSFNQSTKHEVMLANRYVLSISQTFLQNLNKQYSNPSFQEEEISLKQKIKRKIQQDKKAQANKLKTEANDKYRNAYSKQAPRACKPYQGGSGVSSRAILSTIAFHQRQNKTLQDKKTRIQDLKRQKVSSQLRECTFRPKTNTSNSNKLRRI